MNRTAKLLFYGFLTWLIPFVLSFPIFPLMQSEDQNMVYLFKSIMLVVGMASGLWLFLKYFKGISENYVKKGCTAGFIWFMMNVVLDLIVLVALFKSPLTGWIFGIGIRYINILLMGTGIGLILRQNSAK